MSSRSSIFSCILSILSDVIISFWWKSGSCGAMALNDGDVPLSHCVTSAAGESISLLMDIQLELPAKMFCWQMKIIISTQVLKLVQIFTKYHGTSENLGWKIWDYFLEEKVTRHKQFWCRKTSLHSSSRTYKFIKTIFFGLIPSLFKEESYPLFLTAPNLEGCVFKKSSVSSTICICIQRDYNFISQQILWALHQSISLNGRKQI